MAYLFSRLNDAIEGASGGRRATDVLQSGPAQQDLETLGGQQAPGIASQSSAVISGAQPAAAQPNAAGENAQAVSSESRGKVFAKNQQGINANVTGGVTSGIAKAGENLQAEANKYAAANRYQAFEQGTANKAVDTGDADAAAATRAFLGGASKPAEAFSFNDASLEGLRDSTRALQDRGGLANQLASQSGMSQGEARLDAQFLERSGAAGRQRAEAARAFADLAAKTDTEGKNAEAVVKRSEDARKIDVEAVRRSLQGRATSMVDADAQAGRDETASRQALNDRAGSVREEMLQTFLKRPEFADAGFAGVTNRDQMRKIFDDPSLARFLTAGGGVGNYVSQETAARFNRINEMLGLSDRTEASGSLAGRGGFDEAGYRAALQGLLGKLKLNAPKTPAAESAALPVPIAGRTFNQIEGLIEGAKSAGRAADPTSATSRTNPISGTANTVAKATAVAASKAPKAAKPVAKAVAKVADKGAKVAQKAAKKLDPRRW